MSSSQDQAELEEVKVVESVAGTVRSKDELTAESRITAFLNLDNNPNYMPNPPLALFFQVHSGLSDALTKPSCCWTCHPFCASPFAAVDQMQTFDCSEEVLGILDAVRTPEQLKMAMASELSEVLNHVVAPSVLTAKLRCFGARSHNVEDIAYELRTGALRPLTVRQLRALQNDDESDVKCIVFLAKFSIVMVCKYYNCFQTCGNCLGFCPFNKFSCFKNCVCDCCRRQGHTTVETNFTQISVIVAVISIVIFGVWASLSDYVAVRVFVSLIQSLSLLIFASQWVAVRSTILYAPAPIDDDSFTKDIVDAGIDQSNDSQHTPSIMCAYADSEQSKSQSEPDIWF